MSFGRDERVIDLFFLDGGSNPAEEGLVRLVGTDLVAYLGGSVKSLTGGGAAGITEVQHRAQFAAAHDFVLTSYSTISEDGNEDFSKLETHNDNGKSILYKEVAVLTRTSDDDVATMRVKQFDAAGGLLETIDLTFIRDAEGDVVNIDRTRTVAP